MNDATMSCYLRQLEAQTQLWQDIKVDIDRLGLVYIIPVGQATVFGGIAALGVVLGEWKAVGDTSLVGVSWRCAVMTGAAYLLYKLLRLNSMISLPLSWLKVACFEVLLATLVALLVESSTVVHEDFYLLGWGNRYLTQDPLLPFVLSLLFTLATVSVFIAPVVRATRLHGIHLQARELLAVTEKDAPATWQLIREVAEKVSAVLQPIYKAELPCERMRVLLVRKSSYAPGVLQDDEGVALLLPRRFLTLVKQESTLAAAIIAHEIAHVFHGDSNLWYSSVLMQRAHLHRTVPAIALLGVAWVLALGSGMAPRGVNAVMLLLVTIGAPILVWRIREKMRRARQSSEILADLVAALSMGAAATTEAVQRFSGHSESHTETASRLFALQALPGVLRSSSSESGPDPAVAA